jgi:hypothetical protein
MRVAGEKLGNVAGKLGKTIWKMGIGVGKLGTDGVELGTVLRNWGSRPEKYAADGSRPVWGIKFLRSGCELFARWLSIRLPTVPGVHMECWWNFSKNGGGRQAGILTYSRFQFGTLKNRLQNFQAAFVLLRRADGNTNPLSELIATHRTDNHAALLEFVENSLAVAHAN